MADDLISSTTNTPAPDGAPAWMKRVPMITGALAALAAFLTVRAATMADEAIYRSNQAVLYQAKSSDAWAEYQSNSQKKETNETAALIATDPAIKHELEEKAKRFGDRQPAEKADAEKYKKMSDDELTGGKHRLGEKDLLDYAGVAAQLGIALASVAALTRRQDAFGVGVAIGVVGVALTIWGLLAHYF